MINWKVRFSNRLWVISFITQLFILVEVMLVGAHAVGLTDFQLTEEIKGWGFEVVNALFGVLATLGVVQDPTTVSLSDSEQAKRYKKPRSSL
ncbi:phage holin [Sutcliffiella rhizosphaerae]|uniref:Phage holin n=1 Tax=Sutcliffiella rhizosphaerae TaxID=2880967 RepID=A0ABM8YQ24_9BACI|nr:phage holin [Sutcliffiella rhizosphaerae]CAG9622103.1 hypothetical protein BACCIP111883_02894 [Sutcliffiella rhizosphaerae]